MCQYAPVPANMLQHCTLSPMDKSFLRRRPCFGRGDFCRFAYSSFPTETCSEDISVFACASNGQDSPKTSPRAIFKWKNLIEPLNLLLEWMQVGENWVRWVQCANMWPHVATLQFFRCAEKDNAGQDPCFRRRWLFQIFLHRERNIVMNASANFS